MISARDRAAIRLGLAAARRAGLGVEAARLAVACGFQESRLGVQKPFLLPSGAPSFNWGATTARSSSIPSFGGGDKDYNGNPISQRWAKWRNMDEGLAYWLSFPQVRRCVARGILARGDERAFAQVLFDGGYYTAVEGTPEQRVASYASWMRRGKALVVEAESGEIIQQAFGLGAVAGGLWLGHWAWRQYRGAA